jgi:aminopeptidase N
MPSHEEQWLTESFAEYSAALFIRAGRGEAQYKSIVNHWRPNAKLATDKCTIPLANRVYLANDARTQFFIRTGLLYMKGPLLLYALHKQLGDETFLTFLKSYQRNFRWKFGSTKTVVALLNFMTKKDFNPFFDENYWGTGMPKD